MLYDSVRGVTEVLISDDTNAEAAASDTLTSFDSDGFSVGGNLNTNYSGKTYVGWNWKAGGAPTATNSAGAGNTPTAGSVKIDGSNLGSALAGSIPATKLSASTTAGISIVTYVGTGSNGTVAHGLGVTPEWVVTKSRDSALSWYVYVPGKMSTDKVLAYNATNAEFSSAGAFIEGDFNATTFGVGTETPTNKSGDDFIAYCFHSVDGYSKVGSYVGNGSADGTFVFTGFRPAFLLTKEVTATSGWNLRDSVRSPENVVNEVLQADTTGAEMTSNYDVDFLSNGFKLRTSASDSNTSGNTYVYLAFAEQPFKFANSR